MDDDDTAALDAAIARTVEPINKLLDRILIANGTLITVQKDVAVIKTKQDVQGGEIRELKRRVEVLHDKVDRMPDKWRGEIKESVSEHRKQDDRITGAHDLPQQHWKQQAYSTSSGFRRDNGMRISRRMLITIGKILGYVILGIGATYGFLQLPGLWL